MFIELTSDELLREWLPKLVGIERSVALRAGDGRVMRAAPEAGHAAQLTRTDITSSVHYIAWSIDEGGVASLGDGPVELVIDHPSYSYSTTLSSETVSELLDDLGP